VVFSLFLCYILFVIVVFFFFFFQAEVGIRDGHVTGVQTCALPISPRAHRAVSGGRRVGVGRLRGAPETARCARGGDPPAEGRGEIGRASCRERVEMWGIDVGLKKKTRGKEDERKGRRQWVNEG